jgi:signal peptidase I
MNWLRKWILRWEVIVGFVAVLFVAWFGTRAFLFDYFRVPSASMHPTIPAGSFIVVDKRGYGNYGLFGYVLVHQVGTAPVERTNIIVSGLVKDPRTHYVHRVIGLPGDRVAYAERQLTINGEEMPVELGAGDGRLQYAIETIDGHPVTIAFMPERYSRDVQVVVPEGHLFVLGDNRDNARDSRFIGFVPTKNIIGRVIRIYGAPASESNL